MVFEEARFGKNLAAERKPGKSSVYPWLKNSLCPFFSSL